MTPRTHALIGLLGLAMLTGCTGASHRPDAGLDLDEVSPSSLSAPTVDGVVVIGGTSARILRRYHAASGRLCVSVELLERELAERIACRDRSGVWSLRRPLAAADRGPSV